MWFRRQGPAIVSCYQRAASAGWRARQRRTSQLRLDAMICFTCSPIVFFRYGSAVHTACGETMQWLQR